MPRPRRVQVRVGLGFGALATLLLAAGATWSSLWAQTDPLQDGAVLAVLIGLGILAHEGGHALAGELTGHRLQELKLSFKCGVRLQGTPRRWRRVLISLSGPLFEGVFGAGVLIAAWHLTARTSGPEVLAGALMVLNALAGTLPLGRQSDGWKAWRGAKEVALSLTGRERSETPERIEVRAGASGDRAGTRRRTRTWSGP